MIVILQIKFSFTISPALLQIPTPPCSSVLHVPCHSSSPSRALLPLVTHLSKRCQAASYAERLPSAPGGPHGGASDLRPSASFPLLIDALALPPSAGACRGPRKAARTWLKAAAVAENDSLP